MKLHALTPDTYFRFFNSETVYQYYGNGWYGRPYPHFINRLRLPRQHPQPTHAYSGGPWHQSTNVSVIVVGIRDRCYDQIAKIDALRHPAS